MSEAAPSPEPEAGPSTAPAPSSAASDAGPSRTARWRPLPRTTFRSIEYTGPMQRPEQILNVIQQADIDECFNAPMTEARQLEMKYRPERSSIPVRGLRVASQKLLVKVVRKRRRGPHGEPVDGGAFTANVVGSIPQTVRFRAMADYQYTPPQDGHVTQLVQSLADLDYDAILDYEVPLLHEEVIAPTEPGPNGEPPAFPFRSLLELQPTPIMSQRQLPHAFNYKMNAQTVEERVWDEERGIYKNRYVNKSRISGWAVPVIGHGHPVPLVPPDDVKEMIPKLDARIYNRILELMEERPVWQRYALLAQFSDADRYEIESNKVYFPATGFTYGAGPYWKCIVRYGYDPCTDPAAHKYQRVYVYLDVKRTKNNVLNAHMLDYDDEEEVKRPSFWWEHEQQRRIAQGLRPPIDPKRVYFFDGKVIHRNKPDYQLIDITDPLIAPYISDPQSLGTSCEPHSGWYRPLAFELIKALLRVRYAHLRDRGEPMADDDEACAAIVEAYDKAIGDDDKEGAEAFFRRLAAARREQNLRT